MIDLASLHHRLHTNKVIPLNFCNNKVLLDASGALIWPSHDLIIFSDLHFEKGSFLCQFAHPLPRHDTRKTLENMQTIQAEYKCKWIVCLGDSLHDHSAHLRMQQEDVQALNDFVDSAERFTWVLGNHDPDIPDILKGERQDSLTLNNVLLSHEPEIIDSDGNNTAIDGQIVGHFHPKSSHTLMRRKVTGKSYLCTDTMMFMPAFGAYTGGLDANDEAFKAFFKQQELKTFLCYQKRIYLL